jgi:hypothetical protein
MSEKDFQYGCCGSSCSKFGKGLRKKGQGHLGIVSRFSKGLIDDNRTSFDSFARKGHINPVLFGMSTACCKRKKLSKKKKAAAAERKRRRAEAAAAR